MPSNCLGVFVGTDPRHDKGCSYNLTVTVIEFSVQEQSLVLFNLLAQMMLYTQQGTKQSVGQGLEERAACGYYGLHHMDTHTCPPVPCGTLWIPSKVRNRAYPATSPCILLSPAASCTETCTHMCTCTHTHTHTDGSPHGLSRSWPRSPGASSSQFLHWSHSQTCTYPA